MIHPVIRSKPWSFRVNDLSLIAQLIAYFATAIHWRHARVGDSSYRDPQKRLRWRILSLIDNITDQQRLRNHHELLVT